MKESKLAGLLRKLTQDEFKDFEKFTASPFFSKGRDLVPFFRIIKNYYPDFENDELNNEYIFKKLFPGKKFEKVRSANLIKTLSSQLFLLCKEFLIQLELKDDESRRQYYLLNQLRKKKIYNEFNKELEQTSHLSDDQHKGSVREVMEKYYLELVKIDYLLDKDEFEKCFEASITSSEYSLSGGLINAFKHEDLRNIARAYNLSVRTNLPDLLLENLDDKKFYESLIRADHPMLPYLEIYYLNYMMNKNPDDRSHYHTLKKKLLEQHHLFGQVENYNLWNMMLSYCNDHNLPIEENLFIHKHLLEKGIYKKSDDEDFHIVMFRNIVLEAKHAGDYTWLENFINKYIPELHLDHQEDMRNYSLAISNYSRGNRIEALRLLQSISFDLFLYKLDVRYLQLEIYYELGYFEQVHSLIDSTLHFLKKNKELSDMMKTYLKNFMKYLKQFIKIKTDPEYPAYKIDLIRKDIVSEEILNKRDYLVKEIDSILVSKKKSAK